MNLELNGILTQNENKEFILFSPDQSIQLTNLTNILNKIYYLETNNYIDIQIINTNNGKTIFSEKGNLYFTKLAPRQYVLSVDGSDLETILFDNIGNDLEIELFSEALERKDYGTTTYQQTAEK